LGRGLATTHVKGRIVATAVAIGVPAYLAWAPAPSALHRLPAGTLPVAVLTALVLVVARLGSARGALGRVALAAVLVAGTGLGVTLQMKAFGENKGSRVWHAPSDVAAMTSRFDDRTGTVLQVSDFKHLQHQRTLRQLTAKWHDFLPGSLYDVTDVDAVNHYTGMGLVRFERSLCMSYDGFTRPCGYRSIFQPPQPSLPPLADL